MPEPHSSPEAPEYTEILPCGNVVTLVREMGQTAVDDFLDGLATHFAALDEEQDGAVKGLQLYLYEWTVTGLVIQSAGGVKAYSDAMKAASKEPSLSIEEAIAQLSQSE